MDDAVAYRTSEDVRKLRQEIENMAEAVRESRPTDFMKANWHLHAVIANISPNAILKNFYLGLLEVIEQHTLAVQPSLEQPLQGYIEYRLELHRTMVDAIESSNQALAQKLIAEHNTESYQK
jgi:DNA-binding GntR family transcriptional regulator